MSFLKFFQSTVDNWYKADKKTPKIKKEMKEALKQYNWSKWCDDFEGENIEELKKLEIDMKNIYNEVYK